MLSRFSRTPHSTYKIQQTRIGKKSFLSIATTKSRHSNSTNPHRRFVAWPTLAHTEVQQLCLCLGLMVGCRRPTWRQRQTIYICSMAALFVIHIRFLPNKHISRANSRTRNGSVRPRQCKHKLSSSSHYV